MVSQLGEHALSLAKIGELLYVVYRRERNNNPLLYCFVCFLGG